MWTFLLNMLSWYLAKWRDTVIWKGVNWKIKSKREVIKERRNKLIGHICKNVNGDLKWFIEHYNSDDYIKMSSKVVHTWETSKMVGSSNWNKAIHLVALYTLVVSNALTTCYENYSCIKEIIVT